jgi:hypothetical protein
MKATIPQQRTIFRWIHIIVSIPIYGYIYSPFDKIPQYAFPARFIFFPIMVLTGLLMWKGHLLRRLFSKRSAQEIDLKSSAQERVA